MYNPKNMANLFRYLPYCTLSKFQTNLQQYHYRNRQVGCSKVHEDITGNNPKIRNIDGILSRVSNCVLPQMVISFKCWWTQYRKWILDFTMILSSNVKYLEVDYIFVRSLIVLKEYFGWLLLLYISKINAGYKLVERVK